MPRTACIWIPQFELRARLHAAPSLRDQPLLIADAGSLRAIVLDASAEALESGIQRRMPISAARALCPEVVIIPPDPAFVQQLSKRILTQLYRFSPLVGRDGHEAFFVQLEGLEQLHPNEQKLARQLQHALSCFDLTANIAIASSPISAWIVARATPAAAIGLDAVTVVAPDQDRSYLARLPLEAIPMPEQIVRLCRVLGLSRVGDLQQLPRGALTRRFGRQGDAIERRAQARARALFRVEAPSIIEQSEIDLDQPTADLEPLIFLHKSVLDRLIKSVGASRRSIATLELTLVLADSDRSRVCQLFRPARPTLQAKVLLDLMTLWLQSGPVGEPVDRIVMRAVEVGVATARQLHLFDKQEDLALDALQVSLSRLAAAYGPESVVHPRLTDRYLPEGRLSWEPHERVKPLEKRASSKNENGQPGYSASDMPPRAAVLRLLDPPLEIELRHGRLRTSTDRRWRRIIAHEPPSAVEGEWWNNGFAREYLLLTTEDDEVLWIFRDARGYHLQAYLD
jgi:protein ImuB